MKKVIIALIVSAIAAVTISCKFPAMPASSQTKSGGTLDLAIADGTSRTLLPAIDMNVASYDIKGAGPNGATFSDSTTQATKTISNLAAGTWIITVAALNKDGQNIGTGSSSVTVSDGQSVSLSVTVTPIQGTGTISLTTTWPSAEVASPSITASLLPVAGSAIPLTYTVGSGTASVSDASIPNGYYTLDQTLLDNGVLVMGSVEVVRIVAGQTTSGTYDYSNLNLADPTLDVSITPTMNDPLTVSLAGVNPSLSVGGSMTVTPSLSGYTGNVTYVFYVNGQAKATTTSASPSWTFGTNLVAGNYRLDVTAYSADEQRAGSTTASFSVVDPPGTIVLSWNPDSDTAVTGYKVHYGQTSGVYTSVVDAGANTSAIISGLVAGTTYYFVVTAYTATGEESAYSNEISYTSPAS